MKIRNYVFGSLFALGVFFSGCATTTNKGHIDMAYVPQMTDDKIVKNAVEVEFESGLETKINESTLYYGGRFRSYALPTDGVWFNPIRQEYDVFTEFSHKNIDLYFEHRCSHPVNNREYWIDDPISGDERYINHDSHTKIGVRYNW